MQLLLIRHAIAEERTDFARTGQDDSERPLTEYGRRRMIRAARGLRRLVSDVDLIATSPYVRARETAQVVATALGIRPVTTVDALTPDEHPKAFFAWLSTQAADATIIAVGHEPNVSRLLLWSIAQKADGGVEFKKGGAALIDFDREAKAGSGVLRWLVTPSHLRSMAI